jgi:hypothetical protein
VPVFARSGVQRRPDPPAWETDDVPVVAAGTALWAVALVVLAVLDLTGAASVHRWWLEMCGCGVALGLAGIRYIRRRRAAVRQSRGG